MTEESWLTTYPWLQSSIARDLSQVSWSLLLNMQGAFKLSFWLGFFIKQLLICAGGKPKLFCEKYSNIV